jgi:3-mercaptopyruvate sulfurtransferase SseA
MGSIKGSMNVPFPSILNEDGTMKSDEELLDIFKA